MSRTYEASAETYPEIVVTWKARVSPAYPGTREIQPEGPEIEEGPVLELTPDQEERRKKLKPRPPLEEIERVLSIFGIVPDEDVCSLILEQFDPAGDARDVAGDEKYDESKGI